MGRDGHSPGYVPIESEMESCSGILSRHGKGSGHGGRGRSHGQGDRMASAKNFLGAVFIGACVLAMVFDEPMSMKAEEIAVRNGHASMVRVRDAVSGEVAKSTRGSVAMTGGAGMLKEEGKEAANGPTSFQFKVPANAVPGSILHVMVPGGHELHDVKIPLDAKPGEIMFLTLPAAGGALPKEGEPKEGKAEEVQSTEGEPKDGETEGKDGEDDGLSGEEELKLLQGDIGGIPDMVENMSTIEGEAHFWRHWILCVVTLFLGFLLVGYAGTGLFQGFGPIEVDPKKLPDHPCRFKDPKIAELAQAALEANGNEIPRDSVMISPRCLSPREQNLRVARANMLKRASTKQILVPVVSKGTGEGSKDPELSLRDGDGDGDEEITMTLLQEARSEELWLEIWNRGKWLLVLLLFQSTSSVVLSSFHELIKHHLTLTLFLTMLVGAGGNAGAQSVVKDITLISLGHTPGSRREWQRALVKTVIIATALGFGLGFAAYIRVWAFDGTLIESAAIALSCAMIVFTAVLAGTALPFAMIWCGFDPLHSGAVIQVIMDIWGVIVSCLVCQALLVGLPEDVAQV